MNKGLFFLILFALLCGCSNSSDGDDPKQFTLTTGVIIEEWGSVSPAGGTYNEGTEVTLTATPLPGYKFTDWGGGFVQSTDNPLTVKMDRDKIIIAFINTPLYLDENGITVKSYDWGEVGDEVILDGIIYKIVDDAMLREMVINGEDITRVCTTYVTNMNELFRGTSFNQDISAWDVSNVTDMGSMFADTPFNQDLSNWDVTNVVECAFFSQNTPQWTLPKPNFINCNPD